MEFSILKFELFQNSESNSQDLGSLIYKNQENISLIWHEKNQKFQKKKTLNFFRVVVPVWKNYYPIKFKARAGSWLACTSNVADVCCRICAFV